SRSQPARKAQSTPNTMPICDPSAIRWASTRFLHQKPPHTTKTSWHQPNAAKPWNGRRNFRWPKNEPSEPADKRPRKSVRESLVFGGGGGGVQNERYAVNTTPKNTMSRSRSASFQRGPVMAASRWG